MIRYSLNWKVLFITLVMGGLSGVALLMLHAWQLKRTANGLLALAETQEKTSDWFKAAEYLDRYLRLRPNDVRAHVRLALTYGRGAALPEALLQQKVRATELHYRALGTGAAEQEATLRTRLAELLLDTGRFMAAEQEAQRALAASGVDDPQALRVLALALASQLADGSLAGKKTKDLNVVTTVERARRVNPADVRLAQVLATLYREYPQTVLDELGDLTESARQKRANDSLDLLVSNNSNSAPAYLARYQYRARYGLAEASADLETALRLESDNREVRLASAIDVYNRAVGIQQAKGDQAVAKELFAQAQGHYEHLLTQPANQHIPQYYIGMGNACVGLRQIDQALSIWRDGIQRFRQLTTRADFHALVADVCIDEGQLETAGESLNAIEEILSNLGGTARREDILKLTWAQDLRRASWHMKREEFAEAVPLLRKVVSQTKDDSNSQLTSRAWLSLGQVYSALREWRDAAVAFDQAYSLMPTFQPAYIAAANSWLNAGRSDLAVERAEQAIKISATVEAWSAFALAQFRYQLSRPMQDRSWNRFEQSLDVLKNARDQIPGAAAWQIDFLHADYLVVQAKSRNELSQGMLEAAQYLQGCEQRNAGHKGFWADLCLGYQRLSRAADADRALEEFRKAGAETIDLVLLQTRLSSLRGDDEGAKALLKQASKSQLAQDQGKLRQELLRLLLVTKDLAPARAILIDDHERQPHNLMILRQLADVDLERRAFEQVGVWEQKLQGEGVIGEQLARYYRAQRLFDSASKSDTLALREALRDLEQVVLAQPNWPEAASLKGMTEQRLGQMEAAVADYERAVHLGERRVVVFEQLIALLDQLERPADVERYLAQLESEQPLSQRLAELAADQEVRRDRPDRALEIARRRAGARPTDSLAQLWLGRLLLVTNNELEADQAFRKVIELNPANRGGWNGLLELSTRKHNHEGIKAVLQLLESSTALEVTQKSLLIGQAHVSLGNLAEAKRSFTQAADQGQNDLEAQLRVAQFFMQDDPERAKTHLDAALRIDPKSAAAKRMLAIVNAAQGDLAAAERFLTETPTGGTLLTEDVRLHAVLLLKQGGPTNLERAARLLQDVVARSPRFQSIDHLLLARLYEQQAQFNDEPQAVEVRLKLAKDEYLALVERPEADPAHLAALTQFFIRHNKSSEATEWLAKLEKQVESLPKQDPNLVAWLIQTQIQHGSAKRSEKWLKTLEDSDQTPLRSLALRVQASKSMDANADIESLIETRAAKLVAVAKTPEDRQQIYHSVGDLYMTAKKHALAEKWYRLLQNENANQYSTIVVALARQGRLREAIDLCEQTAKADDSARPAIVLATALVEGAPTKADFARAEPLLAAALKRFDSNANLLYVVALARIIEGKTDESIDLFRKFVKINPRSIPALNNLALILAERPPDQAEALQLIDRALNIAGKGAGLLDTKGTILVYSGRSGEAVPLLEAATRDPQADPRHHFHLALAYRDQGKIEDAKTQLKTALDRQLASQVLSPTDKRLLNDLRTALQL